MMPWNVLIVGAGLIAGNHARAIQSFGDRVAAVVDPDEQRASQLVPGAHTFGSLSEAIAAGLDCDAAVVATPSSYHVDQALELLDAGLAVLVEKPHRIPGQSVVELAERVTRGGILYIGMSTRHWPGMIELHRALRAGHLGTIHSYVDRVGFRLEHDSLPPWYFTRHVSGGGVLVTNGVHVLDRARWLLDEDLTVVSSRLTTTHPDHEGEDDATISARTPSGVVAHVSLSWSSFEPQRTGLFVGGTRGNGFVDMSGRWSLVTESEKREGPAIDLDVVPFARQWESFRAHEPGFGLADLEPSLQLIERIYGEGTHG